MAGQSPYLIRYEFKEGHDPPFQPKVNDYQIGRSVYKVKGVIAPFVDVEGAQKNIPIEIARDDRVQEAARLCAKKEAKLLHRARHEHVIGIIMTYFNWQRDGIDSSQTFSIVMNIADHDLGYYIQKNEVQHEWFGCLINAVAHIHDIGIWHRDIKPGNILVRNGVILLADFGISHAYAGSAAPIVTSIDSTPTGTKAYLAPEVESRRPYEGLPAEIYSLGLVFLQMTFTEASENNGENLFKAVKSVNGQTEPEYIRSLLDSPQEHIGSLSSSQRQDIWNSCCRKMLDRTPHRRPTATDLRLWWEHKARSMPTDTPKCSCNISSRHFEYSYDKTSSIDLRKAYENGHRLMLDTFQRHGAEIRDGSALVAAAKGRLWDLVEIAAKAGDVTTRDDSGSTVLHYLAKEGRIEICLDLAGKLVDNGADIFAEDNNGKTVLRAAGESGNPQMIKRLLPQMYESKSPVGPVFDFLQHRIDPGTDKKSYLACHHEVFSGLFCNTKSPQNKKEDEYALAEKRKLYGDPALNELLESNPSITENKNEHEQTYLSIAAMHGHDAMVKLLLHHGADMDTEDKRKRTPLSVAAEYGHDIIVGILLEKNVETMDTRQRGINCKDDYDQTPLLKASARGHLAVVKLLLDQDADVAVKDKAQQTALSMASMYGHSSIVSLLLEEGDTLTSKQEEVHEARRKAIDGGHWMAEQVLGAYLSKLTERTDSSRIEDRFGQLKRLWALIGRKRISISVSYWDVFMVIMVTLISVARIVINLDTLYRSMDSQVAWKLDSNQTME